MSAIFWLAGIAAVLASAIAVTRENPIYTAIFTMVALAGVAVEFALLHSPFLAAMQILLYAGAIMVLFVFVIMLLSLKKEEHGEEPPVSTKAFAGVVSMALFFFLAFGAYSFNPHEAAPFEETDALLAPVAGGMEFGSTEHFGSFLYGMGLVPFELVSVLITAAIAAVVLLARKRLPLGRDESPPPVPRGELGAGPGDA
ncbi:NADH-quinone oxidoreductase subunit J, partial [bacterium]|nr:NADH-quinone oxidoreductase subunit J [bacterium]